MVKVKSSSAKATEDKGRKVTKVSKIAKVVKETKVKAEKLVSTVDEKQKIIEKFGQKKGDTGSPEVQAALLSHKIDKLAEHLEINKKDNHSRRGLLKVIAKRRRILNYLQKLDEKRYKKLIKEIGLKK
jgi:small subunit ribosomal protein S15